MITSDHEQLEIFGATLSLNLRILRDFYDVESLLVRPKREGVFYLEDDAGNSIPLYLTLDHIIGRIALVHRQWDYAKQSFLIDVCREQNEPFCLIDVGANIGLFTRQTLNNRHLNVQKVFTYEPHPQNYYLLERNLAGIDKIVKRNIGLSVDAGRLSFYIDPNNVGNYSLNRNAMPPDYQTISVDIGRGGEESEKWLDSWHGRFIYKSDTQGFDETIATSFDFDFWHRVRCGTFEMWKIEGKSFDVDKFVRILDIFPNKVFESDKSRNLSSKEIIGFLGAPESATDDLLFWR